jgi:hypothetical protein
MPFNDMVAFEEKEQNMPVVPIRLGRELDTPVVLCLMLDCWGIEILRR